MAKIAGLQLIYTRVESEFSPTRFNGYQTYYHSQGLQDQDAGFIVEHIRGFKASEIGESRYQFFVTPSNLLAFSRSVYCHADSQLNDRYGGEIVIAHSVVLKPSDFEMIGNDPFQVFDKFGFLPSPPGLLEYNQQSQLERPCILDTQLLGAQHWDSRGLDFLSLVKFLEQYSTQASTAGLLIYASPGAALEALRTLMQLIPARRRVYWPFDSNVGSINGQPSRTFRIIGTKSRQQLTGFTILDFATGQLEIPPESLRHQSLYANWLEHHKTDLSTWVDQLALIQDISVSFEERREVEVVDSPARAYQDFYIANQGAVNTMMLAAFRKAFQQASSGKWASDFIETCSIEQRLSIAASQSVPPALVSSFLRDVISSRERRLVIRKQDWPVLLQLSKQIRDPVLRFWIAAITNDAKEATTALQALSSHDYDTALVLWSNPIPAILFLDESHFGEFSQHFEKHIFQLPAEETIEIFQGLCRMGKQDSLTTFIPWVKTLHGPELTLLEKKVGKDRKLPPLFLAAIQGAQRRLSLLNSRSR